MHEQTTMNSSRHYYKTRQTSHYAKCRLPLGTFELLLPWVLLPGCVLRITQVLPDLSPFPPHSISHSQTHQQFTSSVTIANFFGLSMYLLNNFAMLFLSSLDNKYYYSTFLPLFHLHHKALRKLCPSLWNTAWKDKANPGVVGKAGVQQSGPKVLPHLTFLSRCDTLQKNPEKYLWKLYVQVVKWKAGLLPGWKKCPITKFPFASGVQYLWVKTRLCWVQTGKQSIN